MNSLLRKVTIKIVTTKDKNSKNFKRRFQHVRQIQQTDEERKRRDRSGNRDYLDRLRRSRLDFRVYDALDRHVLDGTQQGSHLRRLARSARLDGTQRRRRP